MNTSNGFESGYYQPKETRMYFWKCTNDRCSWQSEEAKENEDDLKAEECCPECKCSSLCLDSDLIGV